jgi:ABC-type amino acid transport substrate-binding protein
MGRGDRFSRAYASLNPGSIVIYTGGGSATSKALGDGRLQKYFTRAGHRVQVANDSNELARALQAGSIDIVLADLDEALLLVPGINAASSKPVLMPVEGKGNAAPKHQFAATLKSTDKINGFLAKIDDAMKDRSTPARKRS